MLSSRFKPWHVLPFLVKYAWLTVRRRPVLVHFEVTMRCNARCGFCDYWKTPAEEKDRELKSFADAARFFNPMMVTFTGGEPLLRRDLEDVVRSVHDAIPLTYLTLITHGAMLSADRALSLWDAGISQFSISLDYLDGRHDTARGIPRLTARIFDTVDAMRIAGVTDVRFNTVIKNDNLDQLLPLVQRADSLGVGVNFSVYTDFKNGNADFLLQNGHVDEAERVIGELLAFKRRKRGVISNSDHYLEQIPRYLRGEYRVPCNSGIRTIHIDPTGYVKRCPDFPTDFHWKEWKEYTPINCNSCFYACRGEAEAPLRLDRVLDILA
jgi:MoaA/NifB/PqqE/SkfB family radical SAM enzyme